VARANTSCSGGRASSKTLNFGDFLRLSLTSGSAQGVCSTFFNVESTIWKHIGNPQVFHFDPSDSSWRTPSSILALYGMELRSAIYFHTRTSRFAAFILALCTPALWAQDTANSDVAVYFDYDRIPAVTLGRAQQIASQILATAGVRLKWRIGSAPARHTDLLTDCTGFSDPAPTITVDPNPPRHRAGASSDALAYTFPYAPGGVRIYIYYDKLDQAHPNSPRITGILLGHVLAHEITHALERIDRHSNSGLMKARWTATDYGEMQIRPLPLADEDRLLIGMGLDSWRRQSCPKTMESAPIISAHAELP